MENRKIIVSLYLAGSMVLWFLSRACFHYFYLGFERFRRIPGVQTGSEAVPVILGLVCFIILMKNTKTNELMDEVVSELKKVTWPGREDVVLSTKVVLVLIVLISLLLAGFDLAWGKIIGVFLS